MVSEPGLGDSGIEYMIEKKMCLVMCWPDVDVQLKKQPKVLTQEKKGCLLWIVLNLLEVRVMPQSKQMKLC